MQLTDITVINTANNWLANNKAFWLCTILHTYGSAPRPIGSIFITDGEERCGSISGGCLEDAFVTMISQGQFTEDSQLFTYGNHIVEGDILRELPCGGSIELLVEYIKPNDVNKIHIIDWLTLAHQQKPFLRQVNLNSAQKTISELLNEELAQIEQTSTYVRLAYAQVFSLLLIGIGQVTEHIAQLGLLAGFDVKVCDMRKELASSWHFDKAHGGIDVCWQSPDLFIEQYATKRSAVLALAHDPRIDDVAMMSVFDSPAFYIGAMGSLRTSEQRQQRLKRVCEITDQQLTRLHAPIGLNIGSKTPVEIAIATLADIIRVRHKISKQQL